MLPSALTEQLEQGMEDYLRASFWSSTPAFQPLVDEFVGKHAQLFRGPYFSIKLPFRSADNSRGFDAVPLPFPPYTHQDQAFKRLRRAQNTIVATGTGSGKTECFLVPTLAHCAEQLGTPGIKAIILYPMNALAADQATRIAELVHQSPGLDGVRVGMYVGSREKNPTTSMTPGKVITDRDTLRQNPPDILLTNYKMLDYLLVRPQDQPLWRDNGRETLKYLIVDELHTFDGAQGTDLACLIRRLKARLHTPTAHLTCVGTSATLGGDASVDELRAYASQIFGEEFEPASVITEIRKTVGDFLGSEVIAETDPPANTRDNVQAMDPRHYPDEASYLDAQIRLWFPDHVEAVSPNDKLDRLKLGEKLKAFHFVRLVLSVVGNGVKSMDAICHAVFKKLRLDDAESRHYARLTIASLFALFSAARDGVTESPEAKERRLEAGEPAPRAPLVQVRVQLWQREMRRMVASVEESPQLAFADDLTAKQAQRHLPVVYCRDCGIMGWGALVHADAKNNLATDLRAFYNAYFGGDARISFVFPKSGGPPGLPAKWLNTTNLVLQRSEPDDASGFIEVVQPAVTKVVKGHARLDKDCPSCNAPNMMSILGLQAATLTSVFISQLFASRFNDDKKLLTFSDSVQDAAHRAGFFGARAWNFNIRLATQQAIESQDEPLPLSELPSAVTERWREELGSDDAFAGMFTPNDMFWLQEYRHLVEKGQLPEGDEFIELVGKRLSWEIHSEYGLRSKYGRSLPRVGASVTYIAPDRLSAAVPVIADSIRNEFGGMQELELVTVERMIVGIVTHMIRNGGIFQPEIPLNYYSTGGDAFGFRAPPHLPTYGRRSHLPAFVTRQKGSARFHRQTRSATPTWYQNWVQRLTESTNVLGAGIATSIVEYLFDALVDAGILTLATTQNPVWAVDPRALLVTNEVVEVTCDASGERFWVAQPAAGRWEGMPSMSPRVLGSYSVSDEERETYYRRLYRNGEVTRINAAEHTGLLDRDTRESVEESFKADDATLWDINLLSCTPTLEMGIDIGALSSSILCSVPPSVSSFVQRIGRAGRRDGNSLILTVANAQPHDLYFFENTEEMVDGSVETPGIFLNASAVLSRQLTAFCFDRWVEGGVKASAVPRTLGEVLRNLDKTKSDVFPHNFLTAVEVHETAWLSDFLAMFDGDITDATRQALREFFTGGGASEGSLRWRIISGLSEQRKEREVRKKDLEKVRKVVKLLEGKDVLSPSEEEELEEQRKEERALASLIRQLEGLDTLQFFTDEGLIPNYAFPEAGVELKSIIWRSTKKADGERTFDDVTYEYERPARSAISELAPNNNFYAGGRQVQIDQVDIKTNPPEPWRFCPNCSYAQSIAGADEHHKCPSCESDRWRDVGQRRDMLKLRRVFARSDDKASRIGDDSDDRSSRFYNRQTLATFHGATSSDAYSLKDSQTPFGFEYFRTATFREINFGDHESIGTKLSVAGVSAVRNGFELCKECGKVQPGGSRKREPKHAAYCSHRKAESKAADFAHCLYLYREFASEAVRILLPFVDELGYEAKLHSFVAAFDLGLKLYFGGRVDHLRSTVHSEPVPDSTGRKQYLVVYDTVPGGTGYLRELVRDPETLFDVLEVSLRRMRACECNQNEEKDGCYRCLLAHRHAFDMRDTSRRLAVQTLSGILDKRELLAKIEGLSSVNVGGLLDSILEMKFLDALHRRAHKDGGSLRKEIVRGKPGYRLSLPDDVTWLIEPQVTVGPPDGVVVETSIDFVFRPDREDSSALPIAVFTDGFAYHSTRLAWDFMQRMSLVRSGRFRTWSVTWEDVLDPPGKSVDVLGLGTYERVRAGAHNYLKGTQLGDWLGLESVDLLYRHLSESDDSDISQVAAASALGMIIGGAVWHHDDHASWREALEDDARPELSDLMCSDLDGWYVGGSDVAPEGFVHRVYAAAPVEAVQAGSPKDVRVLLYLDDEPVQRDRPEFIKLWQGTLRAFNLLQFVDEAFVVTTEKQGELDLAGLLSQMTQPDPGKAVVDDYEWEEAMSLLLEASHVEMAQTVKGLGAPAPMGGYALTDERGHSAGAMSELGWEDARVAVVLDEEVETKARFEAGDWLVFNMSAAQADPESVARTVVERT